MSEVEKTKQKSNKKMGIGEIIISQVSMVDGCKKGKKRFFNLDNDAVLVYYNKYTFILSI